MLTVIHPIRTFKSILSSKILRHTKSISNASKKFTTNASAQSEQPLHWQVINWAKENPGMAVATALCCALELSPYGPTRFLVYGLPMKIIEKREQDKLNQEEKAKNWEIIQITVPANYQAGDTIVVHNKFFPNKEFTTYL